MGKRHTVPASATPRARCNVTGLLKLQGRSEFAPIVRKKVCRVELEIGDMDLDVVAYGDLADRLSSITSASVVQIEGELRVDRWKTGDGTSHHKTVICAEEINVAR